MKRRSPFLLLLAAALLAAPLSACSGSSGGSSDSSYAGAAPEALDGSTALRDSASAGDAVESEAGTGGVSAEADRAVIRTGQIFIEVGDPGAAADEVSDLAKRLGGSVESSSVQRSSGETAAGADLTVRVPEDRIDEAFDELEKVGDVVSQSSSAEDVTEQQVDLQARVKALEASVQRLTKLMADSDSTADLIEAESALSQRQQELDGLRAQLKALEGQVSQATIWVSLSTRSALPGGGPANFWEGLLAGLGSLASTGSGALVLLGILLPWLAVAAVVALVVILIVRAARSRRRARVAGSPAPVAAAPAGQPAYAGYDGQTPPAAYAAPAEQTAVTGPAEAGQTPPADPAHYAAPVDPYAPPTEPADPYAPPTPPSSSP